jgi:hypothetical protein
LKKPKERDNLKDLSMDGKYNKLELTDIRYEDVNWTHLPQYNDLWRGLVNTTKNLRVS